MIAEWYAPKEIRFTEPQILWVLKHLEYMIEGYWPNEHRESGYEYLGGQRSGSQSAYFETPVGVAAELTARLVMCEDDGLLLEFMVASGYEDIVWFEGRVARYQHTTSGVIHTRIKTALNYCQGVNRKNTSYRGYKAGRSSYLKKRDR